MGGGRVDRSSRRKQNCFGDAHFALMFQEYVIKPAGISQVLMDVDNWLRRWTGRKHLATLHPSGEWKQNREELAAGQKPSWNGIVRIGVSMRYHRSHSAITEE